MKIKFKFYFKVVFFKLNNILRLYYKKNQTNYLSQYMSFTRKIKNVTKHK